MKTPTLGEAIQAARRAQSLSQEALAEKIGVSRQALGKWEKDAALPGLDNLQALAQVLHCSVDSLLGTAAAGPAEAAAPAEAEKTGPESQPAPALTAETMQALLDAHAAAGRRGERRRWALLAAALLAAALLAAVALAGAYRQLNDANQRLETMGQRLNGLAGQLDATGARMTELQNAVRKGESAVLDWQWLPAAPAAGQSETNILVTPRNWQPGMTADLLLDHGDETDVVAMTTIEASGRLSASPRLTVGESYALSVRLFDTAGASTVETLGELCLTDELLAPVIAWPDEGNALFGGFYTEADGGGWQISLSWLCPEIAVVSVPPWLDVDGGAIKLYIDGEEVDRAPLTFPGGEPLPDLERIAGGTWQAQFDKDRTYPCRDLGSVQWVAELTAGGAPVWQSEPLALHELET